MPPYMPSFTDEGWARGFIKRMAPAVEIDMNELKIIDDIVSEYISERQFQVLPKIDITVDNLKKVWLDGSKYTRRQRQHYCKILGNYLDGKYNESKMYEITSFIKKELYDEHKESRTIAGPSDLVKCLTAFAIKPIEQQVYNHHYIKHHSRQEVIDMVNKIRYQYPTLYETDYTSFEGTISSEIMKHVELKIFEHFLQNNKEIYEIIERIDLAPTVYKFNQSTYAKMSGSRKSGCLWTSLGNGLTNEILMRYLARKNDVDIEYLVEGDDGLIGTHGVIDFAPLASLGFKVKAEACTDINELSFCGMIFSVKHKLTCKLESTLNQFGYSFDKEIANSVNLQKNMRRLGLLKAKAMSYYYMYPTTPVISELSAWIIDNTSHISIRPEYFDWWEYDTFGKLLLAKPDTTLRPTENDILFAMEHQHMSRVGYEALKRTLATTKFEDTTQLYIRMDVLFKHDSSNVLDYVFN